MGIKIASIASDGFNYEAKGLKYDPYLQSFIMGSGGSISDFVLKNGTTDTLVIRGLGGGGQKAIKYCLRNKIDFYAIDSGYIQPGAKKDYHRITKNALQNLGPIKDRGLDRLKKLNWQYKNRNGQTGNKILICPPSDKVMKFYEKDLDTWLAETIDEIKTYTDRPIEVRLKPNRSERVTTNTIWNALDDAYCLVTFNSIAATEALLYSVPAITLAPNAASVLCNTAIKDFNNLYLPTKQEIVRFAAHLSYCQFNSNEMLNGFAWSILNEGS
jgi:hypothetical protein